MSTDAVELSQAAREIHWLMEDLVTRVPSVRGALAVSSDGLLMARSSSLDRVGSEHLAAVVAGFRSLGDGAAPVLDIGQPEQVVLVASDGFLVVSAIGRGSALGAITGKPCDLGMVGYELALAATRIGGALTPALMTELKRSVLR
jgi:predicted regulator of Ras-like GTPase activity (Roadblock/LC7/MglB family)